MIKTIIFDFDGTLADTLPFTFKKIIEIARRLKLSNQSDQLILEEIRSKSYRQLMKEYKLSWLKLPWLLSITRQMQKELTKVIEKQRLFSGMRSALQELRRRNIRLGILTSNIKENIDRFLRAKNIMIFDYIHCEKNILGKDRALINLIKKNSLKKDEVVYVGDEIRDIDACKKAGVKIIAVTWGFNTKKVLENHQPDYIINKPREILNIVKS